MNENDIFQCIEDFGFSLEQHKYEDLLATGYDYLVKLHDLGLSEDTVYKRLDLMYKNFGKIGNESAADWIADLMDFVTGWCVPQKYIWRQDGIFDRSLNT